VRAKAPMEIVTLRIAPKNFKGVCYSNESSLLPVSSISYALNYYISLSSLR